MQEVWANYTATLSCPCTLQSEWLKVSVASSDGISKMEQWSDFPIYQNKHNPKKQNKWRQLWDNDV